MVHSRLVTAAAVAVFTLSCAPRAHTQTVSLDAVYVGTAGWEILSWPRSAFGAHGDDLAAASGLTTCGFSGEGFVDAFGDQGFYQNDGLGGISFSAPNGDKLEARITGQGTLYHYSGSFEMTSLSGKGRFAGATGRGTFLLEAGPYDNAFVAPAKLTVHGSVSPVAVPEPGTLALLAGPLAFIAGRRLKRTR